jgi:hypothetical protein
MTPLYNHVLMALLAIEEDLQPLYKETLSCLWTKTENSETIQKSCFVAKKRLSTSFGMGGLQIPPLEETSDGLRINLIQKYHCKIVNGNESKYTQLIGENLHRERKPDLQEHVNSMSPREWMKTGAKLKLSILC